MIIGGVVPAVNIKGVGPGQMVLDGATVASIYLGEISKWTTRASEAHPKLALPDTAIAPVYRSDGSGTNFLFSDYLSKASPKFKETVGSRGSTPWGMTSIYVVPVPPSSGLKRHHPQTFRAFP